MTIQNQSSPVVLVVEDEILIRDCIVAHLQEAGFDVIAAADAEQAFREFEHQPCVTTVFNDVRMPGRFDGLSLAAKVVKLRPDVQVIVTSGLGLPNGAVPAGADFLPKPYDCTALSGLIKAA